MYPKDINNTIIMNLSLSLFLISFLINVFLFMIISSSFFGKFFEQSTLKLINAPFFQVKLFITLTLFFFFLFSYLDLNIVFCVENEKINLGENTVSGNINVHQPNINIPSSVAQGLNNLGLGASIGSGASSAAAVVKKTSLPVGAKLGAVAAGGLLGGSFYLGAAAANAVIQKNLKTTTKSSSSGSLPSSQHKLRGIPSDKSNSSGESGNLIKSPLEPTEMTDTFTAQTVMDLLNATLIINLVMVYLLVLFIIFILGKLVINNQLELNWIKSLPLGDKIHYLVIKILKIWGKSSLFFIFYIWFMLVLASVFSSYFIYVLITNFDSISEVYQNTKGVLTKK